MLPDKMFFNTGIMTFIWILDNKKSKNRKGKVQVIDASNKYQFLKRNLGEKNKEFLDSHITELYDLYQKFINNDESIILDNEDFGYIKATIDRPLYENNKKVYDKKNQIKIDKTKRYFEKIPLKININEYLKTEVEPYIDDYIYDEKNQKTGYEIIPTRLFYKKRFFDDYDLLKDELFKLENKIKVDIEKLYDD